MTAIAAELGNEVQQPPVRQLAGVLLKNCINFRVGEVGPAWTQVGVAERGQVKQAVLGCLGSPVSQARHTAAQVVAAAPVLASVVQGVSALHVYLVRRAAQRDGQTHDGRHCNQDDLEEEILSDHVRALLVARAGLGAVDGQQRAVGAGGHR